MMKLLFPMITLAVLLTFNSCNNKEDKQEMQNPLLKNFETVHGTAPFEEIKNEHYMPAFEEAMKQGRADIDAIVNNTDEPTFENTIVALDNAGELLGNVSSVFFNLNSAATSEEMQSIAEQVSPLMSDYSSDIMLNEKLFERVKAVYDKRDSLDLNTEEKTMLEDSYKGFVRSGANLEGEARERYRALAKELSTLSLQFDKNVLKETNAFTLHITDTNDLAGMPAGVIEAAAEEAKGRELEGWVFTLQYPSYGPFMKYADKRELREKMYKAFTTRCALNNEFNNEEILTKIANLRLEKAQLFGYETYADFVLENRMAETSENVNVFLKDLLAASLPKANQEFAELTAFAKEKGADHKIERWDWTYYSEKLKAERYAISDEMVKPYFKLENVQQGIFDLVNKLYGITFEERTDIQKYHADVTTWEVKDEDGTYLGVLYLDFFPRASKQGGAWMTSFKDQFMVDGKDSRPHVSIVCNFTKPTETKPSLLTFNEVTTFLHEFGHGMHGMLSKCQYKGVSGTSVARDFVELPSQIMENWAMEKEWLDMVAVHYETGEKMPAELLEKIIKAGNFQSGYMSVRQLSFGILDMTWHSQTAPFEGDVVDFETAAMKETELFDQVEGACMSTAFGHIFAGGYAAGYYGYKWAEVLDADAFASFKEAGVFDKATAAKFRTEILEKGGSDKEMNLYVNFKGQKPDQKALLIREGLIEK
jgi:peptidyl-dipeptidase Dcp